MTVGAPPYYPETVVFVLDCAVDIGIEYAKSAQRLELIKGCIAMYAQAKSRVNPNHKYGLAIIRDTVQWEGPGLSSSPEGLAAALRPVMPSAPATAAAPLAAGSHRPLDLGSLVSLVTPLAVAEEADGAKVRVILIYCRSSCLPVWVSCRGPADPGLALDVLFVHDKAAAAAAAAAAGPAGCPSPQEVYTWLEDAADELSARCGHAAYIFEAGGHLVKKVTNLMVNLIAHPAQRPPQRELRPSPLDLAAFPPQATATADTAPPPQAAAAAATALQPPLPGGGGGMGASVRGPSPARVPPPYQPPLYGGPAADGGGGGGFTVNPLAAMAAAAPAPPQQSYQPPPPPYQPPPPPPNLMDLAPPLPPPAAAMASAYEPPTPSFAPHVPAVPPPPSAAAAVSTASAQLAGLSLSGQYQQLQQHPSHQQQQQQQQPAASWGQLPPPPSAAPDLL
ncbi:hypothetical protein HXX76_012500 [Chlamydomonas incerta]|uniref:Uncharacterized protein n=1 Tax=Chlamydomonas incerta TaxID=51695 RepID=A0A835VVR8_CHLIN|nr:hypothetical protein HXX76_012500 [Chlamydomonas incerta]|eukprot:KAG2427304.1 hypothetical protein HXX76_012500 [Chlamydomonas incerta]